MTSFRRICQGAANPRCTGVSLILVGSIAVILGLLAGVQTVAATGTAAILVGLLILGLSYVPRPRD